MNIYQKIISYVKAHALDKQIRIMKHKGNVNISSSALVLGGTSFSLYNPKRGRKYIEIGDTSIVNNAFVIESRKGFIHIGDRVFVGGGTNLISCEGIIVGNDVMISWGCTICDHNSHSVKWQERKSDVLDTYRGYKEGVSPLSYKDWGNVKIKPVKIEDKVWIGFGTTVLKGVTIGEGVVVGANSVVTKDVPPYSVVAGNPAKIVKQIN